MDTSGVDLTALRLTGAAQFLNASQQLRVILFPYTTNTFEAAAKVRVAPGHASWWSSNWLNVHALSRL